MTCRACGAENSSERKFCLECGSALTGACPSCGSANEPNAKFCGQCGSRLEAAVPAPARVRPAAERRVVSVMFADLVGFTRLSEARDAEEVRELLSRYFDAARHLVDRYGGTIEKFIGGAVMAGLGGPGGDEGDAGGGGGGAPRPAAGRRAPGGGGR